MEQVKIFYSTTCLMTFGMMQRGFLRAKTYDKENSQSRNSITLSHVNGNNQMCLRIISGPAQPIQRSTRRLWKKRIFKFLMVLNKNTDEVKEEYLGLSLYQVLGKSFLKFVGKKVMLGESSIAAMDNQSALAARRDHNSTTYNRLQKKRQWCDHCQRIGHTRDTCQKIHGQLVRGR